MARWFGFEDDPTAGGSTLEDLTAIVVPDTFVPVTSAQVDPGLNQLDRDNEVRGRRANVAPISFAAAPSLTFEARAYPKIIRKLLRIALGGSVTPTGTAPASISSLVGPLQSGELPALIGYLIREEQLDRVTGAVVDEIEFNFPIDEEGTVQVTMPALYHEVDPVSTIVDPSGSPGTALPTPDYAGYEDTFMLRDAIAYRGSGAGTEIPNLAGFGFTFNNNLVDDFRSRFRPRHNIQSTVLDSVRHKVWFPNQHKLGPQAVTGRIDLSGVDPTGEVKRLLTHAEKLVFEVVAGPLGTTPAADELLRLTFYKHVLTGGNAEPLQREGDQVASYEFGAYLDESQTPDKDVEATFVGVAALT